jgi:tellurite resistance protein TerC
MLGEHYVNLWLDKNTQVLISLMIIIFCITGSIFYSIFVNKRNLEKENS